MRRGTLLAVLGAAALAVVLLILTGMVSGDDGNGEDGNDNGNGTCEKVSAVVAVFNKEGVPVPLAQVTINGPYPIIPGVTPKFEGGTNSEGLTAIELPETGKYDIAVTASGYEKALLVGREDQMVGKAPEIKCGSNLVRIDLDRVGEAPPPQAPTPVPGVSVEPGAGQNVAPGAFAFVYTVGVGSKDDVCRVLFAHRIITSCDEIKEPEKVERSGSGWSTFVRSGTTIDVVEGVSYSDEPFWHVTFKEPRKDGLEEVFVQRKCGNVSVPPGKAMPPEKPFTPREEVTPTATRTPEVSSPTPSATKTTVVPSSTPKLPTATPTQKPPTATPRATQTAAPTQKPCCTPVPDYTRPADINTPVNTIAVPTETPIPVQTTKPGPTATFTPGGGSGCGYFGC